MLNCKEKQKNREKGITLIALVITIIVLLILAGVTISALSGDNGILSRASEAKDKTELAQIEDEANLLYTNSVANKFVDGTSTITMADIANELNKKGYKIESVASSDSSVTGIKLDNNSITMSTNESATIKVTFEGSSSGNSYYAVVRNKYYKINEEADGGISIDRTASSVDNSESKQLTATVTEGSSVTVGTISGSEIPLTSGSTTGSSTVTVRYGDFTETCNVSVLNMSTESSNPTNPSFSTKYGRIDVIWLKDNTNEVTTTPNAPNLYNNVTGATELTPVTWTYTEGTGETDGTWREDETAKSTWYNYQAGTGTDDNNSSMWANAKNSDGSYFVWIPRYAYRITYYSDPEYKNVTGYYDGYGMWDATDGTLNYKLEEGLEKVKYNGNYYIVHPAFMKDTDKKDSSGNSLNDFDRGGWDKNLTGFWVSKYEMSRTGASASDAGSGYNKKFLSVPGVQSARSITIGNMYTVGQNYDKAKFSHMMKNSEWGAVAYLTQSQYGRNGHEIDINNSSDCITGNGGGSTSVSYASGTKKAYNTTTGAKASTTGNIYGIYDMSGGAWEYVAAFNDTDSNNFESNYGSSFAATTNTTNTTNTSSKFATKYSNNSSTYSGSKIYSVGKTGDSTKEVYIGGSSNSNGWFGDYSYFLGSGYPFFRRGGGYADGSGAGVFCSNYYNGNSNPYYGFRLVLGF